MQQWVDALGTAFEPYKPVLANRIDGAADDALYVFYIGVVLLIVRLVIQAVALPLLRRAWPDSPKTAYKVFDDAYTSLSSGLLVSWGWWVMLTNVERDCTPWHPSGCILGWPNHPVSQAFRHYWLTYAGFYTYEMLGTLLGVGCVLSTEMVVHHVVTLVLMANAYWNGLHRQGLMATNLYDLSNPILHAAKALNHTGWPGLVPAKDALFKLFAATFFVCRCLAAPVVVTLPGWKNSPHTPMPAVTNYGNNLFMTFIQALQFFWFYKIVQVALHGEASPGKKKQKAKAA